jgi:hypothetical protein
MKNILLLILTFALVSCNNNQDDEIQIINRTINIFNPIIKVRINKNGSIKYKLQVSYNKIILNGPVNIEPSDSTYKDVKLDFSKLKDDLNKLSKEIYYTKNVIFTLKAISENEDNIIDTTFTFATNQPPITNVLSAEGDKFYFSENLLSPEIVQTLQTELDIETYREANNVLILSDFIKNKSVHINNEIDFTQNIPLVKNEDMIKYKILVDTLYDYMIVESYPSEKNNYKMDKSFNSYIKSDLISNRISYNQKNKIINENGNYFLVGETQAYYDGISNLYVISVAKNNLFSYNLVGTYIVDKEPPVFKHSRYGYFEGNPSYQGTANIGYEKFYGYSPFSIPFVGQIGGDIKRVLINGRDVKFKEGEEFYFRQSISLANGYNRIPVKLIDKAGNVTETYMPITLESMNNNVNIDVDQ